MDRADRIELIFKRRRASIADLEADLDRADTDEARARIAYVLGTSYEGLAMRQVLWRDDPGAARDSFRAAADNFRKSVRHRRPGPGPETNQQWATTATAAWRAIYMALVSGDEKRRQRAAETTLDIPGVYIEQFPERELKYHYAMALAAMVLGTTEQNPTKHPIGDHRDVPDERVLPLDESNTGPESPETTGPPDRAEVSPVPDHSLPAYVQSGADDLVDAIERVCSEALPTDVRSNCRAYARALCSVSARDDETAGLDGVTCPEHPLVATLLTLDDHDEFRTVGAPGLFAAVLGIVLDEAALVQSGLAEYLASTGPHVAALGEAPSLPVRAFGLFELASLHGIDVSLNDVVVPEWLHHAGEST